MINKTGNIFAEECDAVCITTNGFVKNNGECVMGKGCAKAAAQQVQGLPAMLGQAIRANGNITQVIWEQNNVKLVAFPVKPKYLRFERDDQIVSHMQGKFPVGSMVPGWACKATMAQIMTSADALVVMADQFGWSKVVLPRPGCGAGELDWPRVESRLQDVLDDRFVCMTF